MVDWPQGRASPTLLGYGGDSCSLPQAVAAPPVVSHVNTRRVCSDYDVVAFRSTGEACHRPYITLPPHTDPAGWGEVNP
jgi:hypothetical protein